MNILFIVVTIVKFVFFKLFHRVPVWVQNHWHWDQAQWIAFQFVLDLIWFVWFLVVMYLIFR